MRNKGELSSRGIDVGWPHQIALAADVVVKNHSVIEQFKISLDGCPRGHAVFHEGRWYNVYCFKEPEQAAKFQARFGGEPFNPKQKGRGSSWARWNKP